MSETSKKYEVKLALFENVESEKFFFLFVTSGKLLKLRGWFQTENGFCIYIHLYGENPYASLIHLEVQ